MLASDLLAKHILILYRKDQIALQCLIPQLLLIDAVEFSCNNVTLEWFAVPELIMDAKTQDVLSNQNHFKGKLMSWN